jgi:hypothetical protein
VPFDEEIEDLNAALLAGPAAIVRNGCGILDGGDLKPDRL